MRLIDGDELVNALRELPFPNDLTPDIVAFAVDVLPKFEERRNGEWVRTYHNNGFSRYTFNCSICKQFMEWAAPYCPTCGARMNDE